jgi:hypothetical protein
VQLAVPATDQGTVYVLIAAAQEINWNISRPMILFPNSISKRKEQCDARAVAAAGGLPVLPAAEQESGNNSGYFLLYKNKKTAAD